MGIAETNDWRILEVVVKMIKISCHGNNWFPVACLLGIFIRLLCNSGLDQQANVYKYLQDINQVSKTGATAINVRKQTDQVFAL